MSFRPKGEIFEANVEPVTPRRSWLGSAFARPTQRRQTGATLEIGSLVFTVELAIRDLKGHFGLADYQCYVTTAIHRFVHLACLAFVSIGSSN